MSQALLFSSGRAVARHFAVSGLTRIALPASFALARRLKSSYTDHCFHGIEPKWPKNFDAFDSETIEGQKNGAWLKRREEFLYDMRERSREKAQMRKEELEMVREMRDMLKLMVAERNKKIEEGTVDLQPVQSALRQLKEEKELLAQSKPAIAVFAVTFC